jgi:hypothetical protein
MFRQMFGLVQKLWQQMLCFISFGLVVPRQREICPKKLGQEIGQLVKDAVLSSDVTEILESKRNV